MLIIKPSTYFTLVAFLSHTTTAFYPYQPPPLLTLPLHRIDSRQNTHGIVTSQTPTQANSVAVDQDGQDLSYMVAVSFGDSKDTYHLLLDSAASSTWVMGRECTSEACRTHLLFGKGDSGSLTQEETTPFNMSYGTGSVSGYMASDTLHIASLSPTLRFGLATTVSQEFRSYPMDGILGLGHSPNEDTTSLISTLAASHLIPSALYALHLNRHSSSSSSSPSSDGELTLGALNPARYTGSINYSPLLPSSSSSSSSSSSHFWEIRLDAASLNSTPIALPNQDTVARSAIIDTGTSYMLLPPGDAVALHAGIPHMRQRGDTFYVPCDAAVALSLTFNGVAYGIDSADWRGGSDAREDGLCMSRIVGRQTFGDGQWLLGDVFLKNVYVVFDQGAARLGFGALGLSDQSSSRTATGSSVLSSGTATLGPQTPGSASTAGVNGAAKGGGAAHVSSASASTVLILVLAVLGTVRFVYV